MIQSFANGQNGVTILTSDSAVTDAFGRLRMSQPETLFESQAQYNANPLRIETNATGAGVVPAFSVNTRLITMQVNAGGGGGTSFCQSYQYVPYQPGKSQMILMTGVLRAATAGAVKRFGYGDSLNGIFYEQNGTNGLQINRRTSTSGGVINNTVTQANWNIDRFDGTGPSGVTLDPTKCFILVIDLQFLAMGRVRVGFDVDGTIRYAHQFLNANVLTVPYMQTATLPVMAEIIAASALGAVANADYKCSAVVSEGGFEFDLGRDFSTEGTVTAASGARTHILSLQPLLTFNTIVNRGLFELVGVDILAGANPVKWELCIGAAFTVAPTYAAVAAGFSFMNAGTGGTFNNLTNGFVIACGYIASASGAFRGVGSKDLTQSFPITLDRSGAVRALGTLSLLLTGITGTSDCRACIDWREIR